jgi:thiol:disulfide interchange protein DsbD
MQWIKIRSLFSILLLVCFAANAFAITHRKPLSPEEAFVLTVKVNHANEATVEWHIAKGYYLYRQRLHISLIPNTNAEILYPQGQMKQDSGRGRYEVYTGKLSIPILLQTSVASTQLSIDYQGCSESGFCYPPMHNNIMLTFNDQASSASSPASFKELLTDQNGVRALFGSQHFSMMLLIFTGLGLLLAFTPCVLPMVPILTSIIVGQKQGVNTRKAFFLSAAYVLGSSITYAMAGVIAALMGNSLQAWLQQAWIIAIVSGLFVLLAFSLFGFYDLNISRYWQNRVSVINNKQKSGTFFGVFIMGMVSALIVSPCVTAPLVGVLMYIAETGDVVLGASALFALGMGMGIPLLLVGVSAGKLLPKSGPWMEAMKKIFGVLMLCMAIWILSRVAGPATLLIFSGIVLLGIAIYLAVTLPRRLEKQTWMRPFGYAIALLSFTFMAGGFVTPTILNGWISSRSEIANAFTVVRNVSELSQQLESATASHKPVILDFYADWCESCITMDKKVFNVPAVQQALKDFVLLRADLTANNAADEAILKKFDIVAPPTVLFFNNQGLEVNKHRIVGEVDEKEFTTRLNTFITGSCDKKLHC